MEMEDLANLQAYVRNKALTIEDDEIRREFLASCYGAILEHIKLWDRVRG